MKVLYFSATGNSLYVAKSLGGEAISIPSLMRTDNLTIEDDAVGFPQPFGIVGQTRFHAKTPQCIHDREDVSCVVFYYCYLHGQNQLKMMVLFL